MLLKYTLLGEKDSYMLTITAILILVDGQYMTPRFNEESGLVFLPYNYWGVAGWLGVLDWSA